MKHFTPILHAHRAATIRPVITTSLVSRHPIHPASLHTSTARYDDKVKPAHKPGAPTAGEPETDPEAGGKSFLGALIYGSPKAKAEGLVAPPPGQHSKLVGRGKYVHEKITHAVIPSKVEEYRTAAEQYFSALVQHRAELGGVKLTGSWETIVGNVGEFTHILEYEGYKGYDEWLKVAKDDKDLAPALQAMLKNITSRQHQLVSEFSFWPSSPPRDSGYPDGGVFEMRSYQLQPGKLLEWEAAWRRGLEARRRFVSPVGAFFGQVGQLHEVHHIWQYPDMDTRKITREQAWSVGSWSDTVQETVKLTTSMRSAILKPCSWSPLR